MQAPSQGQGARITYAGSVRFHHRRWFRPWRRRWLMQRGIARFALSLMSVLLIGSCSGQRQAAQTPTMDATAATAVLDSLNKAFIAAVAAKDTDAVVAFYAPDAHVLAQNMARADGHDAIRGMWSEMLRTPGLDLQIVKSEPIVTQAGDMIVDVGAYSM